MPYLLYSGIAFALILRFEFMGKGFTKFISVLNTFAICLIVAVFFNEMFGGGRDLLLVSLRYPSLSGASRPHSRLASLHPTKTTSLYPILLSASADSAER